MAEPFLGEMRWVSFGYAPKGWLFCNGQLLQINSNQALFSLLGTTFGGNGQTNFALPNLQGRVPIHQDSAHWLGRAGGNTAETLTLQQLPQHMHAINAATVDGTQPVPGGNYLARAAPANPYIGPTALAAANAASVANSGGSMAHNNMAPYLVLHCIIATQGIFPSQN